MKCPHCQKEIEDQVDSVVIGDAIMRRLGGPEGFSATIAKHFKSAKGNMHLGYSRLIKDFVEIGEKQRRHDEEMDAREGTDAVLMEYVMEQLERSEEFVETVLRIAVKRKLLNRVLDQRDVLEAEYERV